MNSKIEESTEETKGETTEETTDNTVETESEVVVDNTPVIAVGESATTDKCEFTVEYVNITKDVIPPQAGDWYTHYEAKTGKCMWILALRIRILIPQISKQTRPFLENSFTMGNMKILVFDD